MMAPRTLGEIFSFLISDIEIFECNYLKSIEEMYSHPKDEIITHFNISVDESCIHNLRESLFGEVIDRLVHNPTSLCC